MGTMFARAFFYLWPSDKKPFYTDEGKRLRWAMMAVTILHIINFVVALGLVGFWPMLYNLFLASWAYSCYLTLREKELGLYFVWLILFAVLTIMRFSNGVTYGSI